MIATASADDYRRVIEILIRSGECDAVVALFVPPLVTEAADVAREIDRAAVGAGDITVASVFMVADQPPRDPTIGGGAARFSFPEEAVRAIAHATRWSAWCRRPLGTAGTTAGCRPSEAARILARALTAGREWLEQDEVTALLSCYGLPIIPERTVTTVEEAVSTAREFGRPVAIKAIASRLCCTRPTRAASPWRSREMRLCERPRHRSKRPSGEPGTNSRAS